MPNVYVKIIDKNVLNSLIAQTNTFLSMILTYTLGMGKKNRYIFLYKINFKNIKKNGKKFIKNLKFYTPSVYSSIITFLQENHSINYKK